MVRRPMDCWQDIPKPNRVTQPNDASNSAGAATVESSLIGTSSKWGPDGEVGLDIHSRGPHIPKTI